MERGNKEREQESKKGGGEEMNIPVLREMIRVAFGGKVRTTMHVQDIRLRISEDLEKQISLPYTEWVLKQLEAEGHVLKVSEGVWQMQDSFINGEASMQYRGMQLIGKSGVKLP